MAGLQALAVAATPFRDHMAEYRLPNGTMPYLLAAGRLVGQAAAEASPAAVMDMSFADQALSTAYLFEAGVSLMR